MQLFALLDPLIPFLDDPSFVSLSSSSKSIHIRFLAELCHRHDVHVHYTTALKNGSRYVHLNQICDEFMEIYHTISEQEGSSFVHRYNSLITPGDIVKFPHTGPYQVINVPQMPDNIFCLAYSMTEGTFTPLQGPVRVFVPPLTDILI